MNTIVIIIASSVATIWMIGIIIQVLIFSFLRKVCKLIAMAIAADVIDEKEMDADFQRMEEDLKWTWHTVFEMVFWPIMLPLAIGKCMRCSKKTGKDKENN